MSKDSPSNFNSIKSTISTHKLKDEEKKKFYTDINLHSSLLNRSSFIPECAKNMRDKINNIAINDEAEEKLKKQIEENKQKMEEKRTKDKRYQNRRNQKVLAAKTVEEKAA